MKLFRALGMIVALGALLGACSPPAPLALPPLIDGATSSGGTWSVCPDTVLADSGRTAVSPELKARLEEQFPPGTAETALVDELTRQGFEIQPPCEDNPSIRSAQFLRAEERRFFGFVGRYAIAASAFVVWQVDAAGNIAWTTGSVTYLGPFG